jgi:hypothetical protein
MNELHLFSGAGGGILGGILLGHTCVCAVEIEPYCRKVLSETPKSCECCGSVMLRKRYGKHLEDMAAFLKRRFCSLSCANTRTDLTKHGYSWRARKFLKEKCEACGHRSRLQAHHMDQNIKNNAPSNIQTLCKHCHDFWHTTARRRGWVIAGRLAHLELRRT